MWSRALAPRPLVLLLDEADVVTGPALVNLLRQLRSGFHERPDSFPASIVLVGMRDLRDYLTLVKDGSPLNPGSPFNIKAASLTLRNFTRDEVGALYAQHTADTGQVFLPEAVDFAHALTGGQPYLVNALAGRVVDDLVPDRSVPVTVSHLDAARESLILECTTHLDNLSWRLREPRVAKIVQAILLGDDPHGMRTASNDFTYCVDLGLVTLGAHGPAIANPIYREVLARELSKERQDVLPAPWWPWRTPAGRLDFPALVAAFLACVARKRRRARGDGAGGLPRGGGPHRLHGVPPAGGERRGSGVPGVCGGPGSPGPPGGVWARPVRGRDQAGAPHAAVPGAGAGGGGGPAPWLGGEAVGGGARREAGPRFGPSARLPNWRFG